MNAELSKAQKIELMKLAERLTKDFALPEGENLEERLQSFDNTYERLVRLTLSDTEDIASAGASAHEDDTPDDVSAPDDSLPDDSLDEAQ